jgi:hypothetical protein
VKISKRCDLWKFLKVYLVKTKGLVSKSFWKVDDFLEGSIG